MILNEKYFQMKNTDQIYLANKNFIRCEDVNEKNNGFM